MMGTKNNPGAFDCYANAAPDEPMFILLGRDPWASDLVRLWADWREAAGEDPAKVAEARACADQLAAWAIKLGKAPSRVHPLLQRTIRMAKLRQRLERLYPSLAEQEAWLSSPQPLLDGAVPQELIHERGGFLRCMTVLEAALDGAYL